MRIRIGDDSFKNRLAEQNTLYFLLAQRSWKGGSYVECNFRRLNRFLRTLRNRTKLYAISRQ